MTKSTPLTSAEIENLKNEFQKGKYKDLNFYTLSSSEEEYLPSRLYTSHQLRIPGNPEILLPYDSSNGGAKLVDNGKPQNLTKENLEKYTAILDQRLESDKKFNLEKKPSSSPQKPSYDELIFPEKGISRL